MLRSSFALLLLPLAGRATTTPPASIASLYGLTSFTSFPFPTTTLNAAAASTYLSPNHGTDPWSIAKKSEENAEDLDFVPDPFNSSDTGPVLEVTYPADTIGGTDGGATFTNLWPNPNDTDITSANAFESMLLSYEVAFEPNFDWVLGGKLPGVRGGPDLDGCSGGAEPNGSDCFSVRLMWRPDGAGEVYAYVRTQSGLCNEPNIICDSEFGTSIQRGAYSFVAGAWNKISLLVRINSPVDEANGDIQMFYNDTLVIHQPDIQFRTSTDIMGVGGLYFSTFFGGDNSTWETPTDQYSYFRNFEMWGSTKPSNNTGKVVSSAPSRLTGSNGMYMAIIALSLVLFQRV